MNFSRAFDDILDFIFPSSCLGCALPLERGGLLCDTCFRRIPRHRTFFCSVCLARLPEGKKICHRDAAYVFGAATEYSPPTRDLIHALKFKSARRASEPLAKLLIDYLEAFPRNVIPQQSIVVPVPLSPERERSRGFNQAELIAQIFADHFHLPLNREILRRFKHTLPQTEQSGAEERRRNVAGAFEAPHPELIENRHLILIDDVRTSGATLAEAAQTLKAAGVRHIIGLAIARA